MVASPMDPARTGSNYSVLVLRNAAHAEARALFGKLIGTFRPPDTKPSVVDEGGRQVVSMGPMGRASQADWSWWIEGKDLSSCPRHSRGADAVIAAIDGRAEPVDAPIRAELMAAEGSFRPMAFGALLFDRPGADRARQFVEAQGLRRIDLRWGFDGEAIADRRRLDAPAPRKGFMTLFDQPSLPLDELPPIPAGVEQLTVASIDSDPLFNAAIAAADQASPGAGTKAATADRRGDPRRGGPRPPRGHPGGARAEDGRLQDARDRAPAAARTRWRRVAGIGRPRYGIAIEVKDGPNFAGTLDGLMIAANERLERPTGRPSSRRPTRTRTEEARQEGEDGRPSRRGSR